MHDMTLTPKLSNRRNVKAQADYEIMQGNVKIAFTTILLTADPHRLKQTIF